MKKILLLLALFCVCFGQAQIQKIVEPQKEVDIPVVFDSTKNLIRPQKYGVYDSSIQAFVGQKLYLKPLEEGYKRKDGYVTILTVDYDPNKPPYLYRYGNYEKLAEKTFEVISVDTFLTIYKKYVFTLRMVEDESIVCKYIYDGESYSFPFITMSYYNYLCSRLLEQKYVISNSMFKGKTSEELKQESSTNFWTAKNISINDDGVLFVIVTDGVGEHRILLDDFLGHSGEGKQSKVIFEELEWNKLVKLYGLGMMKTVLARKIKVGMPEKLVRYSWGMPERINRSSYGPDQWVYDSQYLYIRNGKVESWN